MSTRPESSPAEILLLEYRERTEGLSHWTSASCADWRRRAADLLTSLQAQQEARAQEHAERVETLRDQRDTAEAAKATAEQERDDLIAELERTAEVACEQGRDALRQEARAKAAEAKLASLEQRIGAMEKGWRELADLYDAEAQHDRGTSLVTGLEWDASRMRDFADALAAALKGEDR